MKKTIQGKIQEINKKSLSNNTQKVGIRLLEAEGEWVPRSRLIKIPSATARIRDLRKQAFGSFSVECKSEISRNGKKVYYYRINSAKLTHQQVNKLFNIS
jgi:hypothetical protein